MLIKKNGKMKSRITPREKEVLLLLAQDRTSKELAFKLFISLETVRSHRKNLIRKLGVKTTAGLIFRSFELGLLCVASQDAA